MTDKLHDLNKYQPYHEVALTEGFDKLIVFTPLGLNRKKKKVAGYIFKDGKWVRSIQPYPAVCHDIGYYSHDKISRQVKKIKQETKILFTGYGLGSKWRIHKKLARFPELAPHLIPTVPLKHASAVKRMLAHYDRVIVKPANVKEGKGIYRLRKSRGRYHLEKHDRPRITFSKRKLPSVIRRLRSKRPMLAQRWIDNRNKDDQVFDVRNLMQKDGDGSWHIAGMAVRQGGRGRITANLLGWRNPFSAETVSVKRIWRETGGGTDRTAGKIIISGLPKSRGSLRETAVGAGA